LTDVFGADDVMPVPWLAGRSGSILHAMADVNCMAGNLLRN